MGSSERQGTQRERYGRAVPTEVVASCGQALRRIRATHSGLSSIGVTSAARGEGRSTLATGLAIADVRILGRRCVLIDLDFAADTPLPGGGPNDLAMPSGDRDGAQSGSPAPDPARSLESGSSGSLADSLMEAIDWVNRDFGILRLGQFDRSPRPTRHGVQELVRHLVGAGFDVIADLPCLPPVGFGDEFAGSFDAMVLVVQAGGAPQERIKQAAGTLPIPPMVLMNRTRSSVPKWLRFMGGS